MVLLSYHCNFLSHSFSHPAVDKDSPHGMNDKDNSVKRLLSVRAFFTQNPLQEC